MRASRQTSLLDQIRPTASTRPAVDAISLDLLAIIQGIRGVCDSQQRLLLLLVTRGRTRAELAVQLRVSENTVHRHCKELASRELIQITTGSRRDAVWVLHDHFLDRAGVQSVHWSAP